MEKVKSRKMWLVVGVLVLLSALILFSLNNFKVEASGQMIVINPGHMDGADPGAVNSSNGIREVDLNNALAIKTVATLRANGYNAMLSHPVPGNPGLPTLLATTPDYNIYTKTICDAANAKGADLLISIHHNSGGNASGYELYWSSYHPTVDNNGIYEVSGLWPDGSMADLDKTPSDIALRSKVLATSFNENFKSLGYVPTRNKIVERDDSITRRTSMPSVLIEAGFVSNNAESQQMANGSNQQKMADQILKSINTFFGQQDSVITAGSVKATVSGNQVTATVTGVTATNGIKQIQFPVWSDVNGQDDIKWYTATAQADGSYSFTFDIKDHNYDTGSYSIHCYGTDNNNKLTMLGNTTVNITADKMSATSTSVKASVSGNQIIATITGITAPNGIKMIQFPVWSDVNGQDDIKWYTATAQTDGSYSVTIDIKDHNYDAGSYSIHCYGTDNNGRLNMLGNTWVNITAEKMSAASVEASVSGNQITATVTGITAPNGIKQIQFPVWSDADGQNDIKWYTATAQTDGSYSFIIDIKNHNYDTGSYSIHCYGTDNNGRLNMLGNTWVNITAEKMSATSESMKASVSGNQITATITGITAPNGIKMIQFPVWSEINGQDDLVWYTADLQTDGSYTVIIDTKNHQNGIGVYNVHCYGTDNNNKLTMLGETTVNIEKSTPIMGETTVSAQQLIDYYENTGSVFPQVYIDRGVDLEDFVNMYIQEANAEGVRAEVAFAQAMLETGRLKFGGDVKVGQFNFAGLGATGGVPGFDFAAKYGDNRTGIQIGIRAHIQHLKCYACNSVLNQVKVDPRWADTIRLRSTTVEGLSGTWAADLNYAPKIIKIMDQF